MTRTALVVSVAAAAACSSDAPRRATHDEPDFCGDAREIVEERIDGLLARMSLAEKVEQMTGTELVAGLNHTAENARLGIPGLRMVDGSRGVRAGHATAFPVGLARGATWDPELERRVGAAIGRETLAKGGNVILAPTINVVRHPLWGRAQESYGEDTLHVGRMGVGFIRGAQEHVVASAKHYALNSIEDTRFTVDVRVGERTLREVYLPQFRMAVQRGLVGSLMSAYNSVNGSFCSENHHLLSDILRDEWRFLGFVESDWTLAVRSTERSVEAGLDIEMPSAIYYGERLVEAVGEGVVAEEKVDRAVRRILRTKLCFRLDEPKAGDPGVVESSEHLDLALEVAQKAIVVLENHAGLLPIDPGGTVAVVGELAGVANLGDDGTSAVTPSFVVTPLQGIASLAASVTFASSLPLSAAEEASIAAADAVIVVVGLTKEDEGESVISAGDRERLELSAAHEALVSAAAALSDRVVVVLEGGSAIAVESWIDAVEAVLMAWYPGQRGGTAIADVLFGRVNPSGRLPLTFPRALGDLPPFDNQSSTVTYGPMHGYRYQDALDLEPRFPLGFGLSFTTFEYSGLRAARDGDGDIAVDLEVTNTGDVAGDEVVQLYVSPHGAELERPERELAAFERVTIDPGQTLALTMTIEAEQLRVYDVGERAWRDDATGYTVHVGRSARDMVMSVGVD